ncbi:hypothetical protein MTR_8g099825 [Medicago truncatula]|uniref:Uncharacterized protein n=1 Tax=Medicago truncatula TaxID=3880 RepID=A0A072U610_MEDTR|nr:hypothetical protein MTR_8g099825 [Medicago truncatula]
MGLNDGILDFEGRSPQILAGGVGVLRKGSQGTLYAGKVKAFGVPRLLAISSAVCIY